MGTIVCSNRLWPSEKVNERIAKFFLSQVNQIHSTLMKQFCRAREVFSPPRHVFFRRGNSYYPFDACLDNRSRTIHTRNHRYHNPAVAQRNPNSRSVVNRVSFRVCKPKILFRRFKPLGVFVVAPPWHPVVAEAVWAKVAAIENDRAHLSSWIFGEFSGQKTCKSQILGHFITSKRVIHDSACAFKVR